MSSVKKRDYAAKQKGKPEHKEDHEFRQSTAKRDRRRSKDRIYREIFYFD